MPEPLAQLIVEKAEGNALFVEEIASFLIERGTVRAHAVWDWATTPDQIAAALPASVQLLLTARADRLSADDRKLLQTAAVIGRRFDPVLLAAIESGFSDVESSLERLERLDFVQRDPQSGDFEFKHVLMRDALYDTC